MSVRIDAVHIERMREVLGLQPHTYAQLAAITGLSRASVSRWIKTMRGLKKVRIGDYDEDVRGRRFVPMFVLVKKPGEKDAPRPPVAKTAAVRMRNFRARNKLKKAGS